MKRKSYSLSDPAYRWPKLTGIYCIENKTNGKKYYGKASGPNGFYHRWCTHRSDFTKNKHTGIHFQNSYNLYGAENFSLTIVEICPEDILVARENHWFVSMLKNALL